MMSEDGRNGSRPSWHPEAVQALAEETASKQAADERWISRVETGVEEVRSSLAGFKDGTTDWQMSVTRRLMILTDQIQVLTVQRFAWPGIIAAVLLVTGGFAAQLVWLLTHH